ncbi:MAG TPA: sulfotransferase domain-containing protein [Jatrophihabitans sp.]|jgi:hypothetical protein|uniref:sulfotransferase domain-containing protein n=1 Tax=Jatrophihabitans sp. TaxID=1932789 RepID=UPI002EE6A39A
MLDRPHTRDPRVSSLYARNVARTGPRDIVVAGYGGAGQSIVANTLLELDLNYVDPYTEIVHEDGSSTPVPEHAGFRGRMAAVSQRDGRNSCASASCWPRFFKSHLPPEIFTGRPLAGVWLIVRDPRDALYSWYRWRVAFGEEPWDRVDADWAEWLAAPDYAGRRPVEDWTYFYATWLDWAAVHPRWACTRFEDIKANPVLTFKAALRALGIPVDEARLAEAVEASSFEAMRSHEDQAAGQEPHSEQSRMMRRGKVNEWLEWMTPQLAAHFTAPDLVKVAHRLGYRLASSPANDPLSTM